MENTMLDGSGGAEPFDGDEVEEFDLKKQCTPGKGAPRARRYVVEIDGEKKVIETPKPTGEQLLELAGKCPESFFLQETRTIGPCETVNLRAPGIEQFETIYKLHIEGKIFPWTQASITMEQIATLGGWKPSDGVIQVDADQTETPVNPGQVVTLPTDCSFGKPLRWKRG